MMTRKLTHKARIEMYDSIRVYEEGIPGGGRKLDRALSRLMDEICHQPTRFPETFPGFREAGLKKYSFAIYYTFSDDLVTIVSIFHSSRNPDDLQRRFDEFRR